MRYTIYTLTLTLSGIWAPCLRSFVDYPPFRHSFLSWLDWCHASSVRVGQGWDSSMDWIGLGWQKLNPCPTLALGPCAAPARAVFATRAWCHASPTANRSAWSARRGTDATWTLLVHHVVATKDMVRYSGRTEDRLTIGRREGASVHTLAIDYGNAALLTFSWS